MSARRVGGPAALLAALWATVLWTGPFADVRITDIYVYRFDAGLLAAGVHPYSGAFPLEYPPLALVPIGLARLLGGDGGFEVAFGVLMGLAALATLVAVARLGGPRAAWLFALCPVVCGALLRTHYDLFPAAVLLAALVVLRAQRTTAGMALLGVGAMVKFFPAVLAVVVVGWLLGRGERATALRGAAAFALVVAVCSLPFAGQGYLDAYRFHVERPVQLESAPAVVLYALGGTRVTGSATVADRFRSNGLVGGASGIVEALFALLSAAVLALLAWLASRRSEPDHLVLCCIAAVVAFVALGKVFSPQYVAWLAPLAAVLWAWRERAAAALLGTAVVLTQIEFPRHYAALVGGDGSVRALVAVRDAAVLGALGALIATAAAAARSQRPAAADRRSAPALP